MPTIETDGPPIKDIEVRRTLVKELTEAAVKAYKLPKEAMVVVINENPPENVAVGGELLCDKIRK